MNASDANVCVGAKANDKAKHLSRRRNLVRRLVLSILLTALVSCSSAPDCSDARVIAKVKELIAQRYAQNWQLAAIYDLNESRFDLRAIRTISSDAQQCRCRADLLREMAPNAEIRASMRSKPANDPEMQTLKSLFGQGNGSSDLRYSVERTDDGKDLYVSIERL